MRTQFLNSNNQNSRTRDGVNRKNFRLCCERLEERDVPTVFTVTSSDDSGPDTLRQAIIDASAPLLPDGELHQISLSVMNVRLQSALPDIINVVRLYSNETNTADMPSIDNDTSIMSPGGRQEFTMLTIPANLANTSLTIENVKFINGYGTNGSAIENGSSLTLNNCLFENNISTSSGGAILNKLLLDINNCTFTGNKALDGRGGAIWQLAINGGAQISISDSTFTYNEAQYDGGAIAVYNGFSLAVNNSNMSLNKSYSGSGGAIWMNIYLYLTVSGGMITSNFAESAGAIYAVDQFWCSIGTFIAYNGLNHDGYGYNGLIVSKFGPETASVNLDLVYDHSLIDDFDWPSNSGPP